MGFVNLSLIFGGVLVATVVIGVSSLPSAMVVFGLVLVRSFVILARRIRKEPVAT